MIQQRHFYYRKDDGSEFGPLPTTVMFRLKAQGVITGATEVRRSDGSEWQPFSAVFGQQKSGTSEAGFKPNSPEDMTIGKVLFSFDGRISRSQFWLLGVLPLGFLNLAVQFCMMLLWPIGILLPVLWFARAALFVKRSHDFNRSGWLYILFGLLPSLLDWFLCRLYDGYSSNSAFFATRGLLLLGPVLLWLEAGFRRGTTGSNRFGHDPVPSPTTTAETAERPDQYARDEQY